TTPLSTARGEANGDVDGQVVDLALGSSTNGGLLASQQLDHLPADANNQTPTTRNRSMSIEQQSPRVYKVGKAWYANVAPSPRLGLKSKLANADMSQFFNPHSNISPVASNVVSPNLSATATSGMMVQVVQPAVSFSAATTTQSCKNSSRTNTNDTSDSTAAGGAAGSSSKPFKVSPTRWPAPPGAMPPLEGSAGSEHWGSCNVAAGIAPGGRRSPIEHTSSLEFSLVPVVDDQHQHAAALSPQQMKRSPPASTGAEQVDRVSLTNN
ncbi:unnamed protein product, partial [Amoebophrya sp. A120]